MTFTYYTADGTAHVVSGGAFESRFAAAHWARSVMGAVIVTFKTLQ
jgi:hypothetical protein